jgi:hypothetical protein
MNNTNTNAARTIDIDTLTAKYTAFDRFDDLVGTVGYTPSIRCLTGFRSAKSRAELTRLADSFDWVMKCRRDPRRAWRC